MGLRLHESPTIGAPRWAPMWALALSAQAQEALVFLLHKLYNKPQEMVTAPSSYYQETFVPLYTRGRGNDLALLV